MGQRPNRELHPSPGQLRRNRFVGARPGVGGDLHFDATHPSRARAKRQGIWRLGAVTVNPARTKSSAFGTAPTVWTQTTTFSCARPRQRSLACAELAVKASS